MGMKRTGTLRTFEDATVTKVQHRKPCGDCPWRRKALPGWLGMMSPADWIKEVHGEGKIDCHTKTPQQCAGAAIYRANVLKRPRSPKLLVLPPDKAVCFSSPAEFLAHHARKPQVECPDCSDARDQGRECKCGMPHAMEENT